MKAIVFDRHGTPDVLSLREVAKPTPGDGDVLVRIHAVSVNAADYRSMRMGIIPKGRIFGSDIAGVVEAAGSKVRRLAVGDAVFGDISACGFGGFAEYAAVPERLLALKPPGVPFATAAAVPMAAVTALQGLRFPDAVQPGQNVLIYGAGGGVGSFAVQLARHFGATVSAFCSSRNVELVCSLGADPVMDYARETLAGSGTRYDRILAINGRQSLTAYRRALKPGGTAVIVGGALSQVIPALLLGPMLSLGGRTVRTLAARANVEDLAFIIRLVEAGEVRPVIDRFFPLAETAAAVRCLREGHARGKVVITVP